MRFGRTVNMIRNLQNWNAYLLYKLKGKKGPEFIFQLRDGYKVAVPRQVIPEFKESLFEEVYWSRLPARLLNMQQPVVLDVGANVGFFSISCHCRLNDPRVIAFEPIARNYTLLQKNAGRLPADRFTLLHQALNDHEGELVLKFNSNQEITTSASLFDNIHGSDEEVVVCTSLEAVMKNFELDRIDLLKMDCEGAEYNILYNSPPALFKRVNNIAMETHKGPGPKENKEAMTEWLKTMGYMVKNDGGDMLWGYRSAKDWV